MIKAILFDADNTIYNTKQLTRKANMAAMEFFSRQTTKSASQLYKEWKKIVSKLKTSKDPKKRHYKYSYSMLAKKFNLKKVYNAYEILMGEVIKNLKIEPTFKESIMRLEGFKLVIVTEDFREQTTRKLKKFKIIRNFDLIITNEKVKTMKPSKLYYEIAFKKLRVSPEECIVVGDDFEKDLKIPKLLGCTTVLFKKKDKKAEYCVNSFNDLVKIVIKINS